MKNILALLLVILSLSACQSVPSAGVQTRGGDPFAVLRFKVSGCMSCSHCRSVIRQAERGAGEGRTLSVGEQEAELRIYQIAPIDIRAEVENLLSKGIIRFQVHEVELESVGSIQGSSWVISSSKQVFPLRGQTQISGESSQTFRVLGWDGRAPIALELP